MNLVLKPENKCLFAPKPKIIVLNMLIFKKSKGKMHVTCHAKLQTENKTFLLVDHSS